MKTRAGNGCPPKPCGELAAGLFLGLVGMVMLGVAAVQSVL